MIKKFENYEEALKNSKPKDNKIYYIIIDIQDGIVESTLLFDDKENAYNWIRNFVHQIEQSESNEIGEESYSYEDEFDPYVLIDFYNDKQSGNELFLQTTSLQPYQPLDKDLELKMNSKKYNI